MTKILDNNKLRDMTADEEVQLKKDQDNAKLEKTPIQRIEEQEELKASAKAKLIAGEALTQEEADTIVL
tara:strand:- start:132 stop:338 length:207 start_codon:yes stop_codon:yes gene_type:complete